MKSFVLAIVFFLVATPVSLAQDVVQPTSNAPRDACAGHGK